jgi:quinol monooxygenase YgiN
MVAKTREEPGCRRYDLFQVPATSGGGTFCLIEKYADQAAVQAHRETRHYKEYRANIMALLAQPIEVTMLEPVDARDS